MGDLRYRSILANKARPCEEALRGAVVAGIRYGSDDGDEVVIEFEDDRPNLVIYSWGAYGANSEMNLELEAGEDA
jgi:hypothetical protein